MHLGQIVNKGASVFWGGLVDNCEILRGDLELCVKLSSVVDTSELVT